MLFVANGRNRCPEVFFIKINFFFKKILYLNEAISTNEIVLQEEIDQILLKYRAPLLLLCFHLMINKVTGAPQNFNYKLNFYLIFI